MMAKGADDFHDSGSPILSSISSVPGVDDGAHDPEISDNSAAKVISPSPAKDEAETTPTGAHMNASQTMAETVSSSADVSSKESGAGTASPYGTRSRNRSGGSRPNYAEDREIDVEFEVQTPAGAEHSQKVRHSDVQANHVSAPVPTTRRGPAVHSDGISPAHNMSKDSIPGTSTFSANPTSTVPTQPSKKRKAAAQSTNLSIAATHPSSSSNGSLTGSQTSTRGTSTPAQNAAHLRCSSMFSFENCMGCLKDGKLVADDGTVLKVDDHVYLVCEPPGEPYYLGRIMEFLHIDNLSTSPVDALRMNWYYRPKDIGRKTNDHRQVFASMHSDISPLTSLRGTCQIKHKSEVQNIEDFRKTQDCFWYEKLYDRYIHRYYEVIPTKQVVNVPANVKRVLDARWKFILVESGRGKELTSAVKSCKKCGGYCASNNSVDCGVCHQTYHMNCINPPLLKKPSRGFAWSCGPCSRAQERKLEARNTPNLTDAGADEEEEDLVDDDEDEDLITSGDGVDTGAASPANSMDATASLQPGTPDQIHQASLWPFRYLGIHCKVEDALDYDDRIYPRASSRLGPRHQAEVMPWPGKPLTLIKPLQIKRKYVKGGGHKKDAKLSKDTIAAIEADKLKREKRPKWVVEEPIGYIPRGEDFDNEDPRNTARLLYKPPDSGSSDVVISPDNNRLIDDYITRAKEFAEPIGVSPYFANFLDKVVNILFKNDFDIEISLEEVAKVEKKDLKEPELTPAEQKKFEDGVTKYGSEWHSIKKHVKSVSAANIVRYYYIWKKSARGKQIWGNYSGRKEKKEAKKAEVSAGKLQDDVADAQDDSAFDNEKIAAKKREFQCKFCSTKSSLQWRRAPYIATGATVQSDSNNKVAAGKDKSSQPMVALCLLCAVIWRKYGVQREDTEEHKKNVASKSKRKFDESFKDFQISDLAYTTQNTEVATTPTTGTPVPQAAGYEPARKKTKALDKDHTDKKAAAEKAFNVPPAPEIPKAKLLPCSICLQMEPLGEQHVSCKECRMTVHRNCYGIVGENRGSNKWVCDMCSNDRNPQVSVQYKCMLCPVECTEQNFVEPPKSSHRKRSEKEREKDRGDREAAEKSAEYFKKRQAEMNRPLNPREPLKRTANNNWVHVTCAVWTPEVKFGNAKALEPSEGIPSIPLSRYGESCKLCNRKVGACVTCHCCHTTVHVECAHQNGYMLGFDITPVKGSRRDQVRTVDVKGEVGTMTALIWCKDHLPTKTIVHQMFEIVDDTGLNVLQLYVQNFKQADLTLSGTVRKANLINQTSKVSNITTLPASSNRRISTTVASIGRISVPIAKPDDAVNSMPCAAFDLPSEKSVVGCVTCGVKIAPKWWPYLSDSAHVAPLAASHGEFSLQNEAESRSKPKIQAVSNGHLPETSSAALAAAALVDDSETPEMACTEFQCHKCHFKKVRKTTASPSHPRAPSAPEAHRTHAPSALQSTPLTSPSSLNPAPRYPSWGLAPPYSPPRTFSHWTTHGSSASPPGVSTAAIYSSSAQSPRTTSSVHPLLGQPHAQQASVSLPQSPRMNSLAHPIINGYSHPPLRNVPGANQTLSNATSYISYHAATRLSPQHLTNGGPPPPSRAPEIPFGQNSHVIHAQSQYGHSQASAPTSLDTPSRDVPGQFHRSRSTDGRVNGGASASPSLHNLLS